MAADIVSVLIGDTNVYVQLLRFLVVLALGIGVTRLVLMPLVHRFVSARADGKTTKHMIEHGVGVLGIFLAFIAAMQAANFGGFVTVVGAIAAALTVAVGFGMRDQVSSLVAGVFLRFDPPFVEGDYVSVNDTTGRVRKVNTITTKLQGAAGKKVVVPNNMLTGNVLTNHTRDTMTQGTIQVGVRPEKLSEARYTLQQTAQAHDAVLDTPEPVVQNDAVTGKQVDIELVYYVDEQESPKRVKSDLIGSFTEQAVEKALLAAPEDADDPAE